MIKNDVTTIEKVGQRLDRVWSAIHACMPQNECQTTIYGEVLSRSNELTDVRTNRLVAASTKIPVLLGSRLREAGGRRILATAAGRFDAIRD